MTTTAKRISMTKHDTKTAASILLARSSGISTAIEKATTSIKRFKRNDDHTAMAYWTEVLGHLTQRKKEIAAQHEREYHQRALEQFAEQFSSTLGKAVREALEARGKVIDAMKHSTLSRTKHALSWMDAEQEAICKGALAEHLLGEYPPADDDTQWAEITEKLHGGQHSEIGSIHVRYALLLVEGCLLRPLLRGQWESSSSGYAHRHVDRATRKAAQDLLSDLRWRFVNVGVHVTWE